MFSQSCRSLLRQQILLPQQRVAFAAAARLAALTSLRRNGE